MSKKGMSKFLLGAILAIILLIILIMIVFPNLHKGFLGFLGLGGSEYSWGALLAMAKSVLLEAPHLVLILSLAMSGLIIGLNLFGDGTRDYLDPQTKN